MSSPYGDVDDCKAGVRAAASDDVVMCDIDQSCSADDVVRSIKVVLSSDIRDGAREPRVLQSLDELRELFCSLPHCPRSYALETARQLTPRWAAAAAATSTTREGSHSRLGAATAPGDCAWVHCKNLTHDELREVLSWLPLHASTSHRIEHHRDVTEDVLEYYPTHGYVYAQLCACARGGSGSGSGAGQALADASEGEARVPLLLVAYDTLLFSYCASTFDGESDALFDAMLPSDVAAATASAAFSTTTTTTATAVVLPVTRHDSTVSSRDGSDVMLPGSGSDDFASNNGSNLSSHSSATHRVVADAAMTTSRAAHGVANVFSALVYTVVLRVQRRVTVLLLQADHFDELILQVQPSFVDQNDLLLRVKAIRHRLARLHVELLLKERLLKHLLLLPLLGDAAATPTPLVCTDAAAVARYTLAASATRREVEKLRRARDLVNAASMNLISGVSARLLRHCYRMDYLNNVQTQISLVLMPISVLPALWSTNVKVPWQDLDSLNPFYGLTAVTFALTLIGVGYFCIRFVTFKMPGAIVKTFE